MQLFYFALIGIFLSIIITYWTIERVGKVGIDTNHDVYHAVVFMVIAYDAVIIIYSQYLIQLCAQ